jgi:hypothetical protein
MGAVVDRFAASGVCFDLLPGDRLLAHGVLTDELRVAIRARKADILAELSAATDRAVSEARQHIATPEQASELRALVARVANDWPEAERAEPLAVALADPADALTCFRMLEAEMAAPRKYPEGPYTSAPLAERDPTDDRRTCMDCANLSSIGRCRTPPFAAKRDYVPIPDALKRCEGYRPKPDDWGDRHGYPTSTCVER